MAMIVFAHRGASGYAPENTYAAFDGAVELGADGIETDVRVSADGTLVLLHDETVDRTTNGTGLVAQLRWSDVEALDAGSWFGADFANERIPRLDDFLDRYVGRLVVCLEIKDDAAVPPLIALLERRRLAANPGLGLISFSWPAVARLHHALPTLVIGHVVLTLDAQSIERAVQAGLAQVCPHIGPLDREMVAHAHAVGLQVTAWGLETREDLRHARNCSVDGVTLNWPDWASEAL